MDINVIRENNEYLELDVIPPTFYSSLFLLVIINVMSLTERQESIEYGHYETVSTLE